MRGAMLFVGYQLRQNYTNLQLHTAAVQVSAYYQVIDQIKVVWMQPDFPDLLVRSRAGDETLTDSDRLRLAGLLSADFFGHEITLHLVEKKLIDSEFWQNMFENNRTHLTEPTLIALLKGRPARYQRSCCKRLAQARKRVR